MYQTGRTIKETLDQIQRNELVLPAIQREFVWGANQVCRLFDSLMQGYPFGAFLYWQIEPENSRKFNTISETILIAHPCPRCRIRV